MFEFKSQLLTKSEGLHCPRCGKEDVHHNEHIIRCVNCFKELHKKYSGKELQDKLPNLKKFFGKLKHRCYDI